jgi:hypothetical protein
LVYDGGAHGHCARPQADAFRIPSTKEFLDALKGVDDVEVGPDLYAIHYDSLKKERPDSLRFIRWDPIPALAPATPDQTARIAKAAQLGRQ